MSESVERWLMGLEWGAMRRLEGALHGMHPTFQRGPGLEFADIRPFREGDSERDIDWNASARCAQLHIRERLEDRELTLWCVVDLSPSLYFGSAGRSKAQVQSEAVILLARLLSRRGNRVGLAVQDPAGVAVVPPRAGRRQIMAIAHHLRQPAVRIEQEDAPGVSGLTDIQPLLHRLSAVARRRSLLLLAGDFWWQPGWESLLAQLARRHEVVALRTVDPLEWALDDWGLVPMADAESGAWQWVDTADRRFRARYEAAAAAHEEQLRAALAMAGVDACTLWSDQDPVQGLIHFAQQRQLRMRSTGALSAGRYRPPGRVATESPDEQHTMTPSPPTGRGGTRAAAALARGRPHSRVGVRGLRADDEWEGRRPR